MKTKTKEPASTNQSNGRNMRPPVIYFPNWPPLRLRWAHYFRMRDHGSSLFSAVKNLHIFCRSLLNFFLFERSGKNMKIDTTFGDGRFCVQLCIEILNKRATLVAHLSNFPFATSGVEFSFSDKIYHQTDGVAMGSPLGPALANIYVGL